jgi:predicted nucleic acid-binding protein
MIYFDTSYLVRLHTKDPGWEKVRTLAATDSIACCIHGHAEVIGAFHRKFRENAINEKEFKQLLGEFDKDCKAGAFDWLPISTTVMERLMKNFSNLPRTVHLRAADAMHLACAAESDFKEIFSNDGHLLTGSAYFGLKGVNIL